MIYSLKFAQEFPEDYDGIIAGSPANFWDQLMTWEATSRVPLLPVNSSNFISADLWTSVYTEVLRQCDEPLDGVKDGVIQDPRLCNFRPEAIACRPGATNTSACLNAGQISALKSIYLQNIDNKTVVPLAFEPGSELGFGMS